MLISSLNIKENIKLPLLIHKVNDSHEYFDMLIDRLNLKKILYKYPSSLSSGEKQRSLLARAVILKPKLLIADEPTANLDSNNTHQLVNYLIYLNDVLKTTIIVATHDDIVSNASKRIYELKKMKLKLFVIFSIIYLISTPCLYSKINSNELVAGKEIYKINSLKQSSKR